MTRKTVLAVGLAAAAALPAAASAAPPWSPPATIDAPRSPRLDANSIDPAELLPRLSHGTSGPQLATWPTGHWNRTLALVALDGDRPVRVRTSRVIAASSRYGPNRILHLDARRVGGSYHGFPTIRLSYRLGTADLARLGAARPLAGERTIQGPPVMAVNETGAAIVAWRHVQRREQSDEIQIATRPAGGRFGPVRTLQRHDVASPTSIGVAVDAGGRAVVAYARYTVRGAAARLAVRVVDTRTGAAQDESRIAPPAGMIGPTSIVVGARPRSARQAMVVAWHGYGLAEGPATDVDTAAAVLPAGSSDLNPAQPLAEGRLMAYPRGPIAATVDAAGRPVVAWGELIPGPPGQSDQARTIPMIVQADANGRFGTPQQLDTVGAIGSLIPQGDGLAVGWLRETPGIEGMGSPLGVYVARRGPDGAFGAGELVDDRSFAARQRWFVDVDGLQPPGLGPLPSGGLVAIYADVGANQEGGQNRMSTRPPG